MTEQSRGGTTRTFNINLLVQDSPVTTTERERNWLSWLTPAFAAFEAKSRTRFNPPRVPPLDPC